MNWNNLNIKQKSDIMRVAINNGITDINDIKAKYNEFAEGGDTQEDEQSEGNFVTTLDNIYKNINNAIKVYKIKQSRKADTAIPMTTGGAGYVPPALTYNLPKNVEDARLRLYNQVSPAWGFTDDAINAFKNTLLYNTNAFVENNQAVIDDPWVDGIWAEYLQIPEDKRRSKYKLVQSEYRPTIGDNSKEKYYKVPINEQAQQELISDAEKLSIGDNKLSTALMGYDLGEHTIGKGVDPTKGEYVSYYDRWDLNPLSSRYSSETKLKNSPILNKIGLIDNRKYGDLSFGLGKPIDFYDRIYLNDYYGIQPSMESDTYYGGFLPEAQVNHYVGDNVSFNRVGGKETMVPFNENTFVEGGNLYDDGGPKFSNTAVGRAMQAQYDREHGIVTQKVLPEVEVMPNPYNADANGYQNIFSIPYENRPSVFSQGEISQPYVPKRLDEQSWLNRKLGIRDFDLGIAQFMSNPANVIPSMRTVQTIENAVSGFPKIKLNGNIRDVSAPSVLHDAEASFVRTEVPTPKRVQVQTPVQVESSVQKVDNTVNTGLSYPKEAINRYLAFGEDDALEKIIPYVAQEYRIPESEVRKYIGGKAGELNSESKRRWLLLDFGIKTRLDKLLRSNVGFDFRKMARNFHRESLEKSPNAVNEFKEYFRNTTGFDMPDNIFKDLEIVDELAKNYSYPKETLESMVDDSKMFTYLGDNGYRFLSPDILNEINGLNISKEAFQSGLRDYSNHPTVHGLVRDVTSIKKQVPDIDIDKVLLQKPEFSFDKGLSFTPDELYAYLNFNRWDMNRVHPNLRRGVPLNEMKKNVANAFDEALNNQFGIFEKSGGDFSANSFPMLVHEAEQLVKARAKNGKFPGIIIPSRSRYSNVAHGNHFGNVNIGTELAPKLADDSFGISPTVQQLKSYPNRKYAENLINQRLAKLYKTMQEYSKYPNAYNYGFDTDILNNVIKARGNVDAVPGAKDMMFPNSEVPLWSSFPESSDVPIYPGWGLFFDKGGSLYNNNQENEEYYPTWLDGFNMKL